MVVGEDSGGAGSGAPKDHPTRHRGGRCRGHHEQVREEGRSVGGWVSMYVCWWMGHCVCTYICWWAGQCVRMLVGGSLCMYIHMLVGGSVCAYVSGRVSVYVCILVCMGVGVAMNFV